MARKFTIGKNTNYNYIAFNTRYDHRILDLLPNLIQKLQSFYDCDNDSFPQIVCIKDSNKKLKWGSDLLKMSKLENKYFAPETKSLQQSNIEKWIQEECGIMFQSPGSSFCFLEMASLLEALKNLDYCYCGGFKGFVQITDEKLGNILVVHIDY
jgi:hypothetical protein